MKASVALTTAVLLACGAAVAQAPQNLSYAAALAEVTADDGCRRSVSDAYSLFICDQGLTYWFFTKPGSMEHPGYLWRGAFMRDGAWMIETRGNSEGSDDQQPAFRAWMDAIEQAAAQAAREGRPEPDLNDVAKMMREDYPAPARRNRIEGDVTVSMCVGADGRAHDIKLVKSSGNKPLDDASLKGALKLRFKPARDPSGKAVDWCDPPFVTTFAWRLPR